MPAAQVGAGSFARSYTATNANSGASTSTQSTFPQKPTAGNTLLMFVCCATGGGAIPTMTNPPGWTVGPSSAFQDNQTVGVVGFAMFSFYKPATANETAPVINANQASNNSDLRTGVLIEEWSGLLTSDVSTAGSQVSFGTTAASVSGINTRTKEFTWAAYACQWNNSGVAQSVTYTGGVTQRSYDDGTTTNGTTTLGPLMSTATVTPIAAGNNTITAADPGANTAANSPSPASILLLSFATAESQAGSSGHAVGTTYPTPTQDSGTVYRLSTTASTATSKSVVSVAALGNGSYAFVPETTNSTQAAVPTAPATLASGWDLNPLIQYGDAGTLISGTLTCSLSLTASASLANVTATVIAYVNGAELARGTSASATVATSATAVSASVTIPQTSLPANAKVAVAVYLTIGVVTNFSATTVTLNYGSTGTTFTGFAYSIQASRSMTDSILTSDSVSRRVTVTRSMSDSLPISDSVSRTYTARRSMTDTTSVGDSVSRRYLAVRAISDTILTSDSVSRRYTGARSVTDTILTSDSVSRNIIYARSTMDVLTSGGGGTTVVVKKIIAVFDD